MSETYNGYRNKFTWIIALWFNNDEILFRHWRAVYKTPVRKCGKTYQMTIEELAEHMEYDCQEVIDKLKQQQNLDIGWITDILYHSIAEVDFIEVAKSVIDE